MADNLTLWNKLGKTDPAHTKAFTRGGGFRGTAIKPIYTMHKMTEEFGPVGQGWGFTEPHFQVVPGENKEVLVYCWLALWVVIGGKRTDPIPGVGGDKVVSYIRADTQRNRPERWESDDEAFKKAFTDAIGNAMKHLGMSADVHMGLFDDSKYVSEVRREIAERAPAAEADNSEALAYLALARTAIANAETVEELEHWWQAERDSRKKHGVIGGVDRNDGEVKGTPEFLELVRLFSDRKGQLSRKDAA
jgi:hypothetical protein